MNDLARIFKRTGTPVQKADKAAKAMVLRKVTAKTAGQKKVAEAGSMAGDLGSKSVFKR
jgi:3'-phosphoadenosine 5'-phosphosulfate (PAPS) 3'-phosphatase